MLTEGKVIKKINIVLATGRTICLYYPIYKNNRQDNEFRRKIKLSFYKLQPKIVIRKKEQRQTCFLS